MHRPSAAAAVPDAPHSTQAMARAADAQVVQPTRLWTRFVTTSERSLTSRTENARTAATETPLPVELPLQSEALAGGFQRRLTSGD